MTRAAAPAWIRIGAALLVLSAPATQASADHADLLPLIEKLGTRTPLPPLSSPSACGATESRPEIINGRAIGADEHPSVVLLRVEGLPACTGVLIEQGVLLTAAHCLLKEYKDDRYPYVNSMEISVDVRPGMTVRATELRIHPNYDPKLRDSSANIPHDLALIRLSQAPEHAVSRIAAPLSEREPLPVTIAGFGNNEIRVQDATHTRQSGRGPKRSGENVLDTDSATFRDIPRDSFHRIRARLPSHIEERHGTRYKVSEGNDSGQNAMAAKGDSGGPLLRSDTNEVLGILSACNYDNRPKTDELQVTCYYANLQTDSNRWFLRNARRF